jgi:glycolate oxidase
MYRTPIDVTDRSNVMADSTLITQLAKVVGSKYVSDEPFVLQSYARDFGAMPPSRPDIVVRPGTTEEVVAIMKIANEHRVPVVPRGGGSAQEAGSTAAANGGIV